MYFYCRDTQVKKGSKNNTSKQKVERKLRRSPTSTTSDNEASSIVSQTTESKVSELPITHDDEGAHCGGAQPMYDINEDIWSSERAMVDLQSMPMESLASICEGFDDDIEASIHGGNNFNPYDMEDIFQ